MNMMQGVLRPNAPPRRVEALAYIIDRLRRGASPSYAEIGRNMHPPVGEGRARQFVDQLVKLGVIDRDVGSHRGICVRDLNACQALIDEALEVARIVDEARPEWVFCENVEGHLSLGFTDVADSLRSLGYTTKAGLFTAREAGASHRRRRLFLLAHADEVRRGVRPRFADPGRRDQDRFAERYLGGQRGSVRAERSGSDVDDVLAHDESGGLGYRDDRSQSTFAPGPGELQAWAEFLSLNPGTQPAVLRGSDGLADRVDRTAGVGNGVCSLAAALAWSTLKAAHQLDA